MLAKLFRGKESVALLLLRIAFGLVFAIFGWFHVSGLAGFTNAFETRFHIPFASISAPVAAWVEFLGGIAVLLGVLTRYSGLLLAVVMVVSTLAVRLPEGLAQGRDFLGLVGHWDLDLLLFAIGILLMFTGPGKFSLELALLKREI